MVIDLDGIVFSFYQFNSYSSTYRWLLPLFFCFTGATSVALLTDNVLSYLIENLVSLSTYVDYKGLVVIHTNVCGLFCYLSMITLTYSALELEPYTGYGCLSNP